MGEVVGAEHDVDVAGPLDDQVPVLLREAAAHRDLQVRPAVLQRLQVAEVPVELVVGVLADAAGVEDHDVGRLDVVGRLHPLRREQPGDALRVVLVHLAPEGAYVEAAGHDGRCYAAPVGSPPVPNPSDVRPARAPQVMAAVHRPRHRAGVEVGRCARTRTPGHRR